MYAGQTDAEDRCNHRALMLGLSCFSPMGKTFSCFLYNVGFPWAYCEISVQLICISTTRRNWETSYRLIDMKKKIIKNDLFPYCCRYAIKSAFYCNEAGIPWNWYRLFFCLDTLFLRNSIILTAIITRSSWNLIFCINLQFCMHKFNKRMERY